MQRSLSLARTCASALRKRKNLYSTGAIYSKTGKGDDAAQVTVTMDGYRYRLTIERVED